MVRERDLGGGDIARALLSDPAISGRSPQVVCASALGIGQDGTELNAFRLSAHPPSFPLPPGPHGRHPMGLFSGKPPLNRFLLISVPVKRRLPLPGSFPRTSSRQLHNLYPGPNSPTLRQRRHLRSVHLQTLNIPSHPTKSHVVGLINTTSKLGCHLLPSPNHQSKPLHPKTTEIPPPTASIGNSPHSEQVMQCSQQTQTRRLNMPDGRIPTAELHGIKSSVPPSTNAS